MPKGEECRKWTDYSLFPTVIVCLSLYPSDHPTKYCTVHGTKSAQSSKERKRKEANHQSINARLVSERSYLLMQILLFLYFLLYRAIGIWSNITDQVLFLAFSFLRYLRTLSGLVVSAKNQGSTQLQCPYSAMSFIQ